ncbi:MAG: shikimate kinase [bacterium]
MNERIYLCGFMTSGKSTIGPILANVLGWDFYDLDKVIEENEKKTIVRIFEDSGEEYFRQIESETLNRFTKKKNVVIALGGGTIACPKNLETMKMTGKIIYLKASPEIIYERIKNKIDRPLFRDLVLKENSKVEFILRITELMEKREPFYAQADLVIDSDRHKLGITVDRLVKQITTLLHEKN